MTFWGAVQTFLWEKLSLNITDMLLIKKEERVQSKEYPSKNNRRSTNSGEIYSEGHIQTSGEIKVNIRTWDVDWCLSFGWSWTWWKNVWNPFSGIWSNHSFGFLKIVQHANVLQLDLIGQESCILMKFLSPDAVLFLEYIRPNTYLKKTKIHYSLNLQWMTEWPVKSSP